MVLPTAAVPYSRLYCRQLPNVILFKLYSLVVVIGVCDMQDVGAKSKDFNNLSGKYTMELIVGDAVIENPITWLMVSRSTVCEIQCIC